MSTPSRLAARVIPMVAVLALVTAWRHAVVAAAHEPPRLPPFERERVPLDPMTFEADAGPEAAVAASGKGPSQAGMRSGVMFVENAGQWREAARSRSGSPTSPMSPC